MNDPFDLFFEVCAHHAVYLGHHREYIRAELRTVLEKTGFRVLQCLATDEGMQPQWRALRQSAIRGWIPAVQRHAKSAAAEALGNLWSALALPFGRVLWAVGQKIECGSSRTGEPECHG